MRQHEAWPLFQRLVATLGPLPRTSYRGISRFRLMPLPSTDRKILDGFESTGCDVHSNYEARLRFLALLDQDMPAVDFDYDLLSEYAAACDVFSLLDSPDDYEIIQLTREAFVEDVDCLGFDVGYWNGDHYSIVCDSAVRPLWHPPQPDSFDELADQLSVVNDNFLFPDPEAAARFRAWYVTQSWAETEFAPGEFCTIQVIRPRQ